MSKVDVGRKLTRSNRILVETAASKGVLIQKVKGKKRRFNMTYNEKSYLIRRGQVINAYNHSLALRLCRQKDLTNQYLKHRGFPAPDNATFNKGDHLRAWRWAKDIRPVVLKPVSGSMGSMVFVKISKKREFINLFKMIAEKHGKVLVEEYKQGADHRV